MTTRLLLCAAAIVGGASVPAAAATFNLWYVSEVALVTKGAPVNFGFVTLDRDVLWSQPASFTVDAWDQPDLMDELVRGVEFSFATDWEWRPTAQRLSFVDRQLVSWDFWTPGDRIDQHYAVTSRGDSSVDMFPYYGYDPHEAKYSKVLGDLGYVPDTPEYRDLACGSWVAGYGSDNCNDGLWHYDFYTNLAGTWTEDFQLFAALLGERFAEAAAGNPPYHWGDIPPNPAPVPLPPAALLLVGGLAALGAARQARVAKRS